MPRFNDPEPIVPRKPFNTFKMLSFDIFATCVDWETSFFDLLKPMQALMEDSHPLKSNRSDFLVTFNRTENVLNQEQPKLRYDLLLSESYRRFVRGDLGIDEAKISNEKLEQDAEKFGLSVGDWQAFPDTVDAMKRLKAMGYRLAPLSNVDRASFTKVCDGPLKGCPFDAWYLAEDIGSYKPDLRNFNYLIEHAKSDFGVEKDEILHVAKALYVDHIPTKKMRMSSVFIDRQDRVMGAGDSDDKTIVESGLVGYGWRFDTLGQMVDAIEKERSSS